MAKKHKYKAQKTVIDGIKFPSIAEGRYYIYLKGLKRKGHIKGFELQPKYVLQDKFKHTSGMISAITYKPDFLVFHNDGSEVNIDVKGKSTEASRIRRKMFLKRYPEKVLEWVKDSRIGWIDYFKKGR